jgi:pyrophosphate--fructose-6-phosphate 1-phosphotransferase
MVILFKATKSLSRANVFVEQVIGVPVSLNGDLKNQFVETTVGFDTVCKVDYGRLRSTLQTLKKASDTVCHSSHYVWNFFFQVNSQLISNVCLDAISAGKVTVIPAILIHN